MKNLLFSLMAMVLFTDLSFAQTSNENWVRMMEEYKNSVENVLSKECPKDMDLNKFKISLINGSVSLSENSKNVILQFSEPIKKYGLEFATKNKLESTDESSLIFYSSFSPDIKVENGNIILAKVGDPGLTWAEVGNCALVALGADLAWAWAAGSGTSWSIAALTTTFTGVAKRFLGPIGVGIAVGSFAYCLYLSY